VLPPALLLTLLWVLPPALLLTLLWVLPPVLLLTLLWVLPTVLLLALPLVLPPVRLLVLPLVLPLALPLVLPLVLPLMLLLVLPPVLPPLPGWELRLGFHAHQHHCKGGMRHTHDAARRPNSQSAFKGPRKSKLLAHTAANCASVSASHTCLVTPLGPWVAGLPAQQLGHLPVQMLSQQALQLLQLEPCRPGVQCLC
jgi:hypothetical protein